MAAFMWVGSRMSALVVLAGAAALASCDLDPIHTEAVQALGPEAAGVPKGQYHRAGQPCVTCHGSEGPASTEFTVAGTIFFGPANTAAPVGVGNATVTLEDDSQSQFTVTTNCVGNFYIKPGDWPGHPLFPMLVTIAGQPQTTMIVQSMNSHVGRTGSCADCHQYPTNDNYFETPGIVHLVGTDDPSYQGDPTCAVNPVPPGYGAP
jgi:hypothetical protein